MNVVWSFFRMEKEGLMKPDANDMSRAAELIADQFRDDPLVGAEPYCWGLTLADVAEQVCDLLQYKYPGREEWVRKTMRAGFLSKYSRF
jgi:hypothetical protein